MLTGKGVLITGGTGSFGRMFVKTIFQKYPDVKRVVIFSRDELKQYEMAQEYPISDYPQIRFFLGDIRDKSRIKRALNDIDIVIHAAALKQVPAAEYNPFECIQTNVIGAQNLIDVCLEANVSKVVALSTDKAAAPINLYGATKLCSDKLFVAANKIKGKQNIAFSVVRYGNVMGSRGSVIPLFLKKSTTGTLPITDARMTRFNITIEAGVQFVLFALESMWGGEIFIPKIPSYKIMDVAQAICPDCKYEFIGLRAGEKLHEEMITETDAINTMEFKDYFVILPALHLWPMDEYKQFFNGTPCYEGFSYNSKNNKLWLSIKDIENFITNSNSPQANKSNNNLNL